VAPFYFSSATRPSQQLSRDAPSVIKARIQSVVLSSIICSAVTFFILSFDKNGTALRALHNLGYFPIGLVDTAKSLTLLAILFLGPLYEAGVVEGSWRDWIRLRGFRELLGSWIGYRNLVAVWSPSALYVSITNRVQGPVTEEVLFRSAAVPLFILSRASLSTIIFGTPVIFGLAHIHHFYEFRITHPHTPLIGAVIRSVFQFSFTTLFGSFATFLFLRTGSLLAVCLAHAFCNWMGLPRVWGRVGGLETLVGPEMGDDRGKRNDDGAVLRVSQGRLAVGWTVLYYVLLVTGAVGFYKCLWVLTESESALVAFQ
jgi:prenyl protein peptidase